MTPSLRPLRLVLAGGSLAGLTLAAGLGCARDGAERDGAERAERGSDAVEEGHGAVARVSGADSAAHGFVRFVEEKNGVRVIAQLAGLPPGQHGFHVHENGDCTGPDFKSAGEHFAGTATKEMPQLGHAHGMPEADARHAGDLGNITVDGSGTAKVDRVDDVIALKGDRSIMGRAVVVHAAGDDGKTTQSAGARIACGVIEPASANDTGAADRPAIDTQRNPKPAPGTPPSEGAQQTPPIAPPVPAVP